ncbi:MAG: hypothetical protein HDR22_11095 [Lachnospiraceae bacterium]|nr:hypothetical protein [Lachnospiraceae bacterium]
MYTIPDMNHKKSSKIKKGVIVTSILFLVIAFVYIKEMLFQYSVISDYKDFAEYELFIPDQKLFDELAQQKINEGSAGKYEDTPKQLEELAYDIFCDTVLEMKNKFECEIICFNDVYVGQKQNEYRIYTYDTRFGNSFLDSAFFHIKKGRLFEENKNELIIISSNKNMLSKKISYTDKDGRTFEFPVVGKLKRSYLPVGTMLTAQATCQVMDLNLGKTDAYLLNPDSNFCNSKQVKGNIALVYIKFSEKDEVSGIKYLERFGQVTKIDLE